MEWIGVKNGLPKEFKSVLIFNGVSIYIGHLEINSDGNIFYIDGDDYYIKVTHWMPLPEPPK